MTEQHAISRSDFSHMLDAVIREFGPREVAIDVGLLKKYCHLTGHDFEHYASRNVIPLGFLMTFTARLITDMFVLFFSRHASVIKGVIHSGSKVKVFNPFSLSVNTYQQCLSLKKVQEKTGKKGKFFVVDFEVMLKDQDKREIISDLHQFFLRY